MANLVSPGIQVIEKDASAATVGLSSTVGGTVGVFQWGPVMTPMLIDNEEGLVFQFGKPDLNTFSSFFACTNFLSYTNSLWVTRAETTNLNGTSGGTGTLIKNLDDYENNFSDGANLVGSFAARYPGELGNSIIVSFADSSTYDTWEYKNEFNTKPGTSDYVASKGGSNDELCIVVIDKNGKFTGTVGGTIEKFDRVSKASDGLSYQGLSNYYPTVIRNRSSYIYWMDHPVTGWGVDAVNTAFPSIAVATTDASWTAGVATLTFAAMTTAPVVGSKVIVSGVTPIGYNGTFTVTASSTTSVSYAVVATLADGTVQGTVGVAGGVFTGGTDDNVPTNAELELAWDLFNNKDIYDISLFFTGNADVVLSKYVVDNIAEVRKDCLVFVSIASTDNSPIFNNSIDRIPSATAYKTAIGESTYTVIDSGYKYTYDKYNDKYRWTALNSDIAGLCAQIDRNRDAWFSPAGITKGQIKSAIKLSWNPTQSERDSLYKLSINPVVSFVGSGTMLYGDKTATTKPSAFDRINVRRLFLAIEKSITNSAKYQLFEVNDEITRFQFVASIEPFLRNIQGRRGITAYQVICDDTNNTPQIVQTNQFVGTILVRPVYSINFITLNFTAVGATVSFETAAAV